MEKIRLEKWTFGIISILIGFYIGFTPFSYNALSAKNLLIVASSIGAVIFILVDLVSENSPRKTILTYFSSAIIGGLCGSIGNFAFYGYLVYAFSQW